MLLVVLGPHSCGLTGALGCASSCLVSSWSDATLCVTAAQLSALEARLATYPSCAHASMAPLQVQGSVSPANTASFGAQQLQLAPPPPPAQQQQQFYYQLQQQQQQQQQSRARPAPQPQSQLPGLAAAQQQQQLMQQQQQQRLGAGQGPGLSGRTPGAFPSFQPTQQYQAHQPPLYAPQGHASQSQRLQQQQQQQQQYAAGPTATRMLGVATGLSSAPPDPAHAASASVASRPSTVAPSSSGQAAAPQPTAPAQAAAAAAPAFMNAIPAQPRPRTTAATASGPATAPRGAIQAALTALQQQQPTAPRLASGPQGAVQEAAGEPPAASQSSPTTASQPGDPPLLPSVLLVTASAQSHPSAVLISAGSAPGSVALLASPTPSGNVSAAVAVPVPVAAAAAAAVAVTHSPPPSSSVFGGPEPWADALSQSPGSSAATPGSSSILPQHPAPHTPPSVQAQVQPGALPFPVAPGRGGGVSGEAAAAAPQRSGGCGGGADTAASPFVSPLDTGSIGGGGGGGGGGGATS